ncbi:MAG: outer membrane beta-barrel protein [Deltaproteobacteria bacterium]|nr:outer membrane beta-barrel protein [Deltaproteobacteria bacterium]
MKTFHIFSIVTLGVVCALSNSASATPTVKRSAVRSEHNQKRIIARFGIGGSAPTQDENDTLDGMGLRIGATLGYQIPINARFSVTPQAWLGYSNWSGKNQVSSSMFALGAGAQADYFLLEKLSLWAGGALGGGSVAIEMGSASESKGGFALAVEAGATYFLHEHIGVGAFFGVTNVFAGKDEQTQTEFSATSIDFGVRLRGTFAL